MNEWDEAKRARTLRERGLDFTDAERIFAGKYFTRQDGRREYGETRYITVGFLSDRFVVVVWTSRSGGRRIISLRYGHDWEKERFKAYLD
ncbi:MAG TPA: BrnT family toxin [Stellaceae bacterium]